jgi:hypothetical protein
MSFSQDINGTPDDVHECKGIVINLGVGWTLDSFAYQDFSVYSFNEESHLFKSVQLRLGRKQAIKMVAKSHSNCVCPVCKSVVVK